MSETSKTYLKIVLHHFGQAFVNVPNIFSCSSKTQFGTKESLLSFFGRTLIDNLIIILVSNMDKSPFSPSDKRCRLEQKEKKKREKKKEEKKKGRKNERLKERKKERQKEKK